MKIVLSWLLFLGVIAVNALANILPINGMNTGQVSGFYPNAFVPAGFTFSIWGLIYLLLLTYTIAYTYYSVKRNHYEKVFAFVERINPYFLVTCVLNMAWILVWHYLQIELSVLIMLLFLITLIQLFLKTSTGKDNLSGFQCLFLYTPFMVYLGWISVATIANITALLVAYKFSGLGLSPMHWSVIMIMIALMLSIIMLKKHQSVSFALVVAWAFWGIRARQGSEYPLIQSITTVSVIYLLAMIAITLTKRNRGSKIA
jgi:benzodiazapine receptor